MYQRAGLPEIDDFVICTVKGTDQHAAKVSLDEFKDIEGTVNSSEMDRKWARKIRVFFRVNRKIVCKVMELDKSAKHVFLSTRRVGASQEKTKVNEWAMEKRADDLLRSLSRSSKIKYETLFEKIGEPIIKKYGVVYPFLEQVVIDDSIVAELKLDKKLSTLLVETVKKRIRLKKVKIRGILMLESRSSDGLAVVQETIKRLTDEVKKSGNDIEVKYLGAPKYQIVFESPDLKHGEEVLQDVLQNIEKYIKKKQGSLRFQKVV